MTEDNGLAARNALYERFPVAPVAFSTDGRTVGFAGPLDVGLEIGGLAVVEVERGVLVVHVHDVRLAEREGTRTSDDDAEGVSFGFALRHVTGSGLLVGALVDDAFVRADQVEPFGERTTRPATDAEVAAVLDGLDSGAATIEIGVLRSFPGIPARLRSKGFSRHTFMCGQSGSGKTYTTGVLFERLLAGSTLPMVVIDPNSDHVHLGSLADPDSDSPEAERYRSVASSVIVTRNREVSPNVTLCADFSDLSPAERATLLRLDPIGDLDDYAALGEISGRLGERFSITDVASAAAADASTASLARRIANLGVDEWGIWRRDGERSVTEMDLAAQRCIVIDTGSLATPDERAAITMAILGNRWRLRRARRPILLAIDEAHNVVPASTANPLLRAATESGILIAGEGRKYGLHLFLASQRPGKVHPNVLSQCDNLVLMRMNGADDVADLESMFSHVPPMLLRQALGFGLGQALFAGQIAPFPVFAQVGTRLTPEGGGDVPTTWTAPPG